MQELLQELRPRKTGSLLSLSILVILALGFRFYLDRLEHKAQRSIAIQSIPLTLGEWTGEDTVGLDIRSQEVLKLTQFVKRKYTNKSGQSILLYIGYWAKQTGEYQAAKHSPALCLPSNGWLTDFKEPRDLLISTASGEETLSTRRVVGDYKSQAHLFYYWFFSGEQNYSQEWLALVTISLQNLFAGRSDGGIVEISTDLNGALGRAVATEESSAVIESFVKEFYPALRGLINNPETIQ